MLLAAARSLPRPLALHAARAAVTAPSRGLCRLMLRTDSNPGPPPPSAADQETFDEHLKTVNATKSKKIPTDAVEAEAQAAPVEKATEQSSAEATATMRELQKQARAAAEETRGFEDGLKCDPFTGEMKGAGAPTPA